MGPLMGPPQNRDRPEIKKHWKFPVFLSAPTRTRTLNLLIKSQLLCQLSYRGGGESRFARKSTRKAKSTDSRPKSKTINPAARFPLFPC